MALQSHLTHHPNFLSGIVWDPREPLPQDLQAYVVPEIINEKLPALAFTDPARNRNILPPLSIAIDASILQDTAKITVSQKFWNDSSSIIKEAAYTFPLPTGCTVTEFEFCVGTKRMRGIVKPKDEAREQFDRHLQQQSTSAALLEQDTPEIFTSSLGNLPPKTKITVTLTYITILKHRFADKSGTTTLTIPTNIARRYGQKPANYNDATSSNVVEGLSIQAEVVEAQTITDISSPTHQIDVERRQGTRNAKSFADLAGTDRNSRAEVALIKLKSGSTFLDRDFVLDLSTKHNDNNEPPQAWLETHPTLPEHRALMLTIPSTFLTRPSESLEKREILFLVDLSGSMEDKIAPLKSAMQFFLKGIPEGHKFNIWCFGSSYKSWQSHSVVYAQDTYKSAEHWVGKNFKADMGGTELLPALKATVEAREKSILTDIILLTDGEVWRLDQTLEYVHQMRIRTEGHVRFFALGIGRAVSHALVSGIAKAGGGYADVVREASEGGWEDRVVSMTKAALRSDHLGPLTFNFQVRRVDGRVHNTKLPEGQRSPADFSALNPYDRNRVYLLCDSTAGQRQEIESVTIEASTGKEKKAYKIPVTALEKRDSTIHKLAARSILCDLEHRQSHIHLGESKPVPGSWEETNAVRKEAENIACKWSLASKWTSFLVEEEEKDRLAEDTKEAVEAVAQLDSELLRPKGARAPTLAAGVNLLGLFRRERNSSSTINNYNASRIMFRNSTLPSTAVATNTSLQYDQTSARFHYSPGLKDIRNEWTARSGLQNSSTDNSGVTENTAYDLDLLGARSASRFKEPLPRAFPGVPPQDPVFHILRDSSTSYCRNIDLVQFSQDSYVPKSGSPKKKSLGTFLVQSAFRKGKSRRLDNDSHDGEYARPSEDEADFIQTLESTESRSDSTFLQKLRALNPLLKLKRLASMRRKVKGVADSSVSVEDPTPIDSFSPQQTEPTLLNPSQQPTVPVETDQNIGAQKEFIRQILQFQTATGYFEFPNSLTGAEKYLGAEIVAQLQEFGKAKPGITDADVITIAICVLLKRDFVACQSLWELMYDKADMFVKGRKGEEDALILYDDMEVALKGLKVPF
ncbi:von Willebrand factor type A domain-containing protein [Podospora fimiseda]|uniref:von Willebrand factor type A domain-containing protein n=1 Tax=Podospora fimiseda TaxID=252190 RepID=A0AAN7BL59_9PEZI|nr:von Willebrand factor type A domain-containing protein [Podospora fimiseda]